MLANWERDDGYKNVIFTAEPPKIFLLAPIFLCECFDSFLYVSYLRKY